MNLEELLSECTFERVTPTLLEQCEPFACGHDDLDEFFRSDYKLYADKLLGKTYAFRLIDNPLQKSYPSSPYQTTQFASSNS